MPIYAWGSNGSGQLGIGHRDDVSVPTLHIESLTENGEEVQALTAGGNHTLILFKSGRLAIVGEPSGLVQPIDLKDIKLCSASWDASFVLNAAGDLRTFGTGQRAELGLGQETTQTREPIPIALEEFVPANVEIVQLASGVQHSVAVLSNGEVFGWGNGRKGQLGEPAQVIWRPRRILGIPFSVKRALCGQSFTLLVSNPEEGQCIVLGQNKFGIQSGFPPSIVGWKDIGVNWGSLFILFEDGRLISWGRNDHGQLASPGLSEIEQIAMGSEHALALSKDNKLYAWGWGEHGNCGTKIDESGDAKKPEQIHIPTEPGKIQGIAAGCATSWFWT